MRSIYTILIGGPVWKIPLGRTRRRWKNVALELREIGRGRCGLDSSGPGLVPVVSFCENGNEPAGSIRGGKFLE
jgi:hypothetical protein